MRITLLAILLCFAVLIFYSCNESKYLQTELYFGMVKTDGNTISDSAWNVFVHDYVAKTFSTGFTILNAEGRWLDEKNQKVYSEPSHVIISVYKKDQSMTSMIDTLRNVYKNLYNQESVLRVDKKVHVSF